ncbi:DUF1064 domain-containing protein [Alysiella crassa]|nr:DUF1064 domain-containing protein [Alysiella crassa]UOP06529.1 DUF1064 domain-containing protein [Alysiella crassa]
MMKPNKYRNRKTRGFDSKREADFYDKLCCLKNATNPAERVVQIETQVKFELIPAQRGADGKVIERACAYIADFRVTFADGRVEVIDVKGMKTDVYKIKKKLMLQVHGIQIKEV